MAVKAGMPVLSENGTHRARHGQSSGQRLATPSKIAGREGRSGITREVGGKLTT